MVIIRCVFLYVHSDVIIIDVIGCKCTKIGYSSNLFINRDTGHINITIAMYTRCIHIEVASGRMQVSGSLDLTGTLVGGKMNRMEGS